MTSLIVCAIVFRIISIPFVYGFFVKLHKAPEDDAIFAAIFWTIVIPFQFFSACGEHLALSILQWKERRLLEQRRMEKQIRELEVEMGLRSSTRPAICGKTSQ
jgi:hypothetical protein